jgi:hypothetical protein
MRNTPPLQTGLVGPGEQVAAVHPASAMIFDDHDIRDDWNASLSWKKKMEPTSWWHERIVAGLASYWVYQHLGNLSPQERGQGCYLAAGRPARGGRDRRWQTRPGTGNHHLPLRGRPLLLRFRSGALLGQPYGAGSLLPYPQPAAPADEVLRGHHGLRPDPAGRCLGRAHGECPGPAVPLVRREGPWFDNNLACLEAAPEG